MPRMPSYPGVYIKEVPSGVRTIEGVDTCTTAFIGRFSQGPENTPLLVSSFTEFEEQYGGLHTDSPTSYGVHQFFRNDGTKAWIVRVPDSELPDAAQLIGVREEKTGLYALEDVDLFNILCIPEAADFDDQGKSRAVYSAAEQYCLERRAFLIVDIPEGVNSIDKMETWMSDNEDLRHSNAAVYFPRPHISDLLNENRSRSIGVSGTMAGLYTRIDATRGVWKAPAGVEASLRNIIEPSYLLTESEMGILNTIGINCLRTVGGHGTVSWGARTLVGSDAVTSEWRFINVRRLALFIEESLDRGTKWVVFEPNDESLWAQIRLNAGAFMHSLFRQGAFQGQSPRDAYLVKCDAETTTQSDIDQGMVNIIVGFAPVKPAEFIIIKIQQRAGQVSS